MEHPRLLRAEVVRAACRSLPAAHPLPVAAVSCGWGESTPCVALGVHPALHDRLLALGARVGSDGGYTLPLRALDTLADAVHPSTILPASLASGSYPPARRSKDRVLHELRAALGVPQLSRAAQQRLEQFLVAVADAGPPATPYVWSLARTASSLVLHPVGSSRAEGGLTFRFTSAPGARTIGTSPTAVSMDRLLEILNQAADLNLTVIDVSSSSMLSRELEVSQHTLAASSVPGAPGLVRLSAPRTYDPSVAVRSVLHTSTGPLVALRDLDELVQHAEVEQLSVRTAHDLTARLDALLADPAGRAGLWMHQDRACSRYDASPEGLLCAMAPGTGKTLVAATVLARRMLTHPGSCSVVAVPAALLHQWRTTLTQAFDRAGAELALHLDPAKLPVPGVVLLTHESLSRPALAPLDVPPDDKRPISDLVVDEAHVLAGTRSLRTRRLWELRRRADKALLLTGTPAARRLEDLARLAAFVAGDRAGYDLPPSRTFLRAGLDSDVVFGHLLYRPSGTLPGLSPRPCALRTCTLRPASGPGAVQHEAALREQLELLGRLSRESGPHVAVRRARCKLAARSHATALSARLALDKAGDLAQLIAKHRAPDHPVLVFCQSAPALVHAWDLLQASGFTTLLCGVSDRRSVPAVELHRRLQDNPPDVVLLGPAAQHGLDLQCARTVVHLDLPASTALLHQRIARAARAGHDGSPLQVLFLVHADGLEARLARRLTGVLEAALRGDGTLDPGIDEDADLVLWRRVLGGARLDRRH